MQITFSTCSVIYSPHMLVEPNASCGRKILTSIESRHVCYPYLYLRRSQKFLCNKQETDYYLFFLTVFFS